MSQSNCRPSPLAGSWYPGQPDALRALVSTFLDAVPTLTLSDTLIGVLAPHAGLRYSGAVAAHAFALVRGMRVETVVVIGPLHRPIAGAWEAVLTTGHVAYQTPLGDVPIDREAVDILTRDVGAGQVRFDPEHSVEIELPFLQATLQPGWRLLPIMLQQQTVGIARQVSQVLSQLAETRRLLLVASSDLSHFYDQRTADRLDGIILDAVTRLDGEAIITLDQSGQAFACGRGAIATVIETVKRHPSAQARVLRHATSGAVTHDYREVVGYAAAAFTA